MLSPFSLLAQGATACQSPAFILQHARFCAGMSGIALSGDGKKSWGCLPPYQRRLRVRAESTCNAPCAGTCRMINVRRTLIVLSMLAPGAWRSEAVLAVWHSRDKLEMPITHVELIEISGCGWSSGARVVHICLIVMWPGFRGRLVRCIVWDWVDGPSTLRRLFAARRCKRTKCAHQSEQKLMLNPYCHRHEPPLGG